MIMQLEEASTVLDLLANKNSMLNWTYLPDAKVQVGAVQLAVGGMPCLVVSVLNLGSADGQNWFQIAGMLTLQ